MADNDAPGAWPIWTPGSQLAGIIKGLSKQCFTQNIKAVCLKVSEEKFCFTFFPVISLWRPMTPGRGLLGPQVHAWQDLYLAIQSQKRCLFFVLLAFFSTLFYLC